MSEKKLKTRIQQKTDTKANWDKATNFVPLKGEYIYYSDLHKVKVGDGVTKVGSLPFLADSDTHQSIKTLNTNNTAAQTTSSSEAIAGSGTINLHKVAKTGSYDDLNNKPDLDAKADNHRHFKSGDSQRNAGVYTYYKLASFPIDNSGNSCSLTVDGRIGGWNNGNKGYLSMVISNRDGVAASGTLIGNADLSLCDLVVYTSGTASANSTAILYVKTYSWFAFDLTLGPMSGATDIWDGQAIKTTPAGTLAWTLSGNANKFLRIRDNGDINAGADLNVSGKLKVGGKAPITSVTAGSGISIETTDDGTVKIACSYSDGNMETY